MMSRDNEQVTVAQQVKNLQVLFMAMVAGIVLFGIIALVINNLEGPFLRDNHVERSVRIGAGLLGMVVLYAANRLYRQKISAIQESGDAFPKKVSAYRGAAVLFFVLNEFPALLFIICFLLTGNYLFLGWGLIVLVSMFLKFPSGRNVAGILGTNAS